MRRYARAAARRGAGSQACRRWRHRPQYRRDGGLQPLRGGNARDRSVCHGAHHPANAARDGRPFKGVLFAGLMLTSEGPKLIEFNCRFGDPECQALMMRLQSDIVPALLAARDGVLNRVDLRWYDAAAICVVMAANGYPDDPQRGSEISGLDAAGAHPDVKIFHAGTKREGDRIVADGGRVLGVTATGPDLAAARERAY